MRLTPAPAIMSWFAAQDSGALYPSAASEAALRALHSNALPADGQVRKQFAQWSTAFFAGEQN